MPAQTRKSALATAMSAFPDSNQTTDIAGSPFRAKSENGRMNF
jgi:hypothetical protein